MAEPSLPSDPDSITPAWLSDVLAYAGIEGARDLVGFEPSWVGTGQMGRSLRLQLDWGGDPAGRPASVVAKIPSDDPMSRGTGASQGAYRREVCFYRELVHRVDIRTPHCHFARIDDSGANFVLVMEDMSPAQQGDQIAGCSPDEAELALRELAALHAPCWADPGLADLDFLTQPGPQASMLLQAVYQGLWQGFAERYGDRLSSDHLGVAERLGPCLGAWSQTHTSPPTVVHGDYRLDNLLFGTPEGGAPLTTVDWQTAGRGQAVGDAAYFMGAGLLPEARRQHEERLMRTYHDELLRRGVRDFKWEACWEDYRRFTFAGVIMAVVASMIVQQTDRGDEMFLTMASRHAQHALDLDSEAFLR